ncbi:futalosine hydrolase [Shouchella shacheensis]|uniref:futalosine hydrolase n=1 Tax=Shouchella shacheensis TaxID=1649580 RepID=UPI00073FAA9C|nr:futalosine hydrolase [Shouchella shacheensis]
MEKKERILIIVSVDKEKEAIEKGLAQESMVDVLVGGVGMAVVAARTAAALMKSEYRLVINAGIAGGIIGQAPLGSIVVASSIIAPEIGSESPERFIPIDELGFGTQKVATTIPLAKELLVVMREKRLGVTYGPVLSVLTATGTEETLARRKALVPDAVAEAMEGYGVAIAAKEANVPMLEIRTISNQVGVRDKGSWKFAEAFLALEQVAICIQEVVTNENRFFSVSE